MRRLYLFKERKQKESSLIDLYGAVETAFLPHRKIFRGAPGRDKRSPRGSYFKCFHKMIRFFSADKKKSVTKMGVIKKNISI